MPAAGDLIFNTLLNTDGVSSGISSIEKGFSGITSTAVKMSGAVTAAFSAASAAAVNVGMDFQASMSQVAATMGITADTQAFETLEAAAKEMGETTQFSASQAAEALNYLALAGYDAEKAVAALPTVLDVAAAGGMELAAASDMITDAMSALGLSTDEMTAFADRLAVTAQKSNTSVAQLGEAILTVGGTAKILSGGVVEMNTALGILADNGIKSAEGGTALRNVILSLSAPTNTAAAALAELNVTAFDAAGNMRPLQDTFADLNTALSSLSDQERTAVLNEIFNKVDLKSVNALLGTSAERFEELSGYIADCEGAAADMAKTMNDNLKGDLTILGSALEGAGIAAYEKFELPLRSAVQGVTESVGELTESLTSGELSGSMDKVAAGMSEIAESTLKLVAEDVLPAAIEGFAWIVDKSDAVVTSVGATAAAITAYTLATKGAAAATTALSAAASLNPLGLLAASVAALSGALAIYTANMDISAPEQEFVKNIHEETAALRQQREEFENLKKSQDEKNKADNAEIDNIHKLWNELHDYVDETGNVITQNERANEIIGLLNENYNMNISYIDGQIQGYKDLTSSMDDYIANLRLEAQIRNAQPAYDEAIKNIDDTIKKKEELEQQLQSEIEEYQRVRERGGGGGGGSFDGEDFTSYNQDAIIERIAALRSEIEEQDRLQREYEATAKEFEKLVGKKYLVDSGEAYKSTIQLNNEEQAKKVEEANKATAKKIADQQSENLRLLQEGWENLEHEYATSSTMTEAELYDKKKALWNEYGDASLKDHWKYIEDISKYDKDFAEEQIKLAQKEADEKEKAAEEAAEKEIAARQSEWENIERLNNLGILSDKKAAKARADFVKNYYGDVDFATGKGVTDENYQYLKKVYDDNADMAKQSLDKQKEIVSDGLSDILKVYQNAYDELEQRRKSYRDKLMSVGGDLFSVDVTEKNGKKTTTYTVNNLNKQLRAMREYHSAVKNLRGRGASDALISELTSLNDEDSVQFAKYLSGMSASEFAKINELYNEKQRLADELSQDLYKNDAQMISDSYTNALADLATSSYEYGAQSAFEFAKGFEESMQKLGLSDLSVQLEAAGATRKYENYRTSEESKIGLEVEVAPAKTVIAIGEKVIGEAATVFNISQKRKQGT